MKRVEEYKLDNGSIIWTDGIKYYIDIKPVENDILFRKERTEEISEEIFRIVKAGEHRVSQLCYNYNLLDFIITWGKPVFPKPIKIINTEDKFYGKDFIATKEGEKYFLEYLLSRHGGGSRKFEISKEIYYDARTGCKSTSDLFKKYNLYDKDIPENDV